AWPFICFGGFGCVCACMFVCGCMVEWMVQRRRLNKDKMGRGMRMTRRRPCAPTDKGQDNAPEKRKAAQRPDRETPLTDHLTIKAAELPLQTRRASGTHPL